MSTKQALAETVAMQHKRIDELEATNAALVEALRNIQSRGVGVQREEHRIAREALAKAKEEGDE